jgi:CelD/BcsL family acetyltransferase involved in cellulose biosynthesis
VVGHAISDVKTLRLSICLASLALLKTDNVYYSMPTIRIQRIQTLQALDAMKDIWTDLEHREGGPSIFQSWLWNRTWCEHVLSSRPQARLDVRVVEDGAGRVLAILPFFEEALAGPIARLTQFLGHRMSCHNDILLADPGNPELAEQVAVSLVEDLGYRTVLHLRHLRSESLFTKQLIAAQLADPQCPLLRLRFDPTLREPASRLSRKMRKSLRLAKNRLQREFAIEFRVRSGADFPQGFDVFIDLHRRRFASMGKSTLIAGQNLSFLKTATSMLSNVGHFEILQLQANGSTIAAQLMARDKQCYFSIQGGFDPEFARFSPMWLLEIEAIRRGFEDLGCEYYDIGPGYEPYKYHWHPIIEMNYTCCLSRPNLYAKSMAALYGATFRRWGCSPNPPAGVS